MSVMIPHAEPISRYVPAQAERREDRGIAPFNDTILRSLNAPVDQKTLEEETQRIGRSLFRRVRQFESSLISRQRLEKAMMGVLMKDEELKYRMLRFVDVYPALRSPAKIAQHLNEYLNNSALDLHQGTTPLTGTARAIGRDRRLTHAPIAWASRFGIQTMGKQFIAGQTPEEVAPRIHGQERQGFLFSLDLLGEFVASEAQADEFAQRYEDMIRGLSRLLGSEPGKSAERRGENPRVNISIKLSSLTSKFDPMDEEGTAKSVLARLRPLFRAAQETGAFVNVDMEKYEYRDMTLEIIKRLLSEEEFAGFEHIGTVIQAYLRDSYQNTAAFIDWLRAKEQPMTLRLVKGAYWDSEQIWAKQRGWEIPVYTRKRDTDANYERMTRLLLSSHDIVRTAIASHNVRSIAHALALKKEMKVPSSQFEMQMLFGMAGPILFALRDMGLPVRIYVPTGEIVPGMAYLVRRILENTANDSFLRQRFADGVAEDKLLADPKA
ncbi:MAG: proline dehydrogenase family protein [Sumerlaeia bacterium]